MLHENEQLGESGSTTSTFTVPLHKNEEVLTEKQWWKNKNATRILWSGFTLDWSQQFNKIQKIKQLISTYCYLPLLKTKASSVFGKLFNL